MTVFEASNGVPIRRSSGGYLTFSHEFGLDLGTLTGITVSQEQALREFFQHERDEELGRWRDRRYPDHVVYPSPRTPQVAGRGVQVLDERSGRLYDRWEAATAFNEWDTSPRGLAARAYFEAHPERKPWEDAKPGEVWLLTMDRAEVLVEAGKSASKGTLVFWPITGRSGSTPQIEPSEFRAGRRIWPEDDAS